MILLLFPYPLPRFPTSQPLTPTFQPFPLPPLYTRNPYSLHTPYGVGALRCSQRDWRGFSYAHLLNTRHGGAGVLAGVGESGGGNGGSGSGGGAGGTAVGALGGGGGTGGIENADTEGGIGGGGGVGSGGTGGIEGDDGAEAPYKAGFLDDPALKVGKHRYMTRGDQNTGPVVSVFARGLDPPRPDWRHVRVGVCICVVELGGRREAPLFVASVELHRPRVLDLTRCEL